MRSEAAMYRLILDIANADDRILAVYMNGSRTNKNAPKDIFQDYDIVFVVTGTKPFIEDKHWICKFGNILYMQYPDEGPDNSGDREQFYGWLMQFDDGNRVDLHVETAEHACAHIGDDGLCRILLDKQGILPRILDSTDAQYHVRRPLAAIRRRRGKRSFGCAICLSLLRRMWPRGLAIPTTSARAGPHGHFWSA